MENRKTLTVTLETVTPLFLGGAEPREKPPELRPPAIRGALRYWLRAVLGGVIGDRNLNDLHQLESMVFGSTEYGSPIQVRLRGTLQSTDEKILPHKDGRQAGQRKAFKAGQGVELVMHQLRSADETVWHAACAALNLALTFGGVGLRSRRGLVRICQIKAKSAPEAVTEFMRRVPKDNALGGIRPRQASPLWVRPILLDGSYGLLLTVLASDFRNANYNFVRNFLETFAGQNLTVEGWNA